MIHAEDGIESRFDNTSQDQRLGRPRVPGAPTHLAVTLTRAEAAAVLAETNLMTEPIGYTFQLTPDKKKKDGEGV